jgi:hypothetical protein
LLGKDDAEILDLLGGSLHRLLTPMPDCQAGDGDRHGDDGDADQREAAVGWRLPG